MTVPQSRRHTTATIKQARTLFGDGGGFNAAEIARILTADGTPVCAETVRYWINPDSAQRMRDRAARSYARRRSTKNGERPVLRAYNPEYKLACMKRLRDVGLSHDSIAGVMSVFFGDELSGEQVRQRLLRGRYELRRGRPEGRKAVAA